MIMKIKKCFMVAAVAATLVSCGGGGGRPNFGDNEYPVVSVATTTADMQITYPATIKGFTYANRRQLESAAAKAIRRYQTLKRASVLTANNPTHGEALTVNIEKRLDIAYQIMELLDARLALAEMQENGNEFNESNKELMALESRANVIVADGEEVVQQLPQGFTSGSNRDANTVNSFTE